MSKKNVLLFLVAAFWLINGLFCFCHEEAVVKCQAGNPQACSHAPADPLKDCPNDRGFCCGNFVFTSGTQVESFALPAQESFSVEILAPSKQLNLRSIYHPPKA